MTSVAIGTRAIGGGAPCFVIAEAGVNHNGDLDMALQLVDVAAAAGADAVKFQTFSADTLVAPSAPQFPYTLGRGEGSVSQHEMLRRLELPHDWHDPLRARCETAGLLFLSTPFHESDADWLLAFGVPALKIPSGEVTNLPFLRHVAAMGVPIIASTGMATLAEVDEMVSTIRDAGAPPLVLLHCVSDYPANPTDANLRAMHTMRQAFQLPVGFSDHTDGIDISLAAVALGADVIEKHFTLDRTLPGPDHRASLAPAELSALVAGIRRVESALGTGVKQPAAVELATRTCVRKSLVVARPLAEGAIVASDDLATRRPGDGLSPDTARWIVGRRLRRAVTAGHVLREDDLA